MKMEANHSAAEFTCGGWKVLKWREYRNHRVGLVTITHYVGSKLAFQN
jgi:hypothetical protein